MDTVTSMLGGLAIFANLGNLSHNMDKEDISKIVKDSMGLAFTAYPEAIAKIGTVLNDAYYDPKVS